MSVYKLELEKASIIIKKETIVYDIPDGTTFAYSDFSDPEALKKVIPYVNNGNYGNNIFYGCKFPTDITDVEFRICKGRTAFGSLTNPNINRSGFGATCIFVVSKEFNGSREYKQFGVVEPYFDDWEGHEIPESYFERHIIPAQFCIGYLDVKNKRFVANPVFQFNYGITDEFKLGTTTSTERDLSIEFENNIKRNK